MSTLKVKIDDHELEVEKGTTILQAAQSVGVEIPTFCYHPGLSAPANCRMCLVNTNKAPKLLPACYATCMDGMEVTTQDEKTLRTRKSTLEFILLHHPVDCPICDQAGECVLQDNYFNHSAQPSRLFTRKGHKPKATPIGPNVMLDAERCIVCTRCVRFCQEVTKTNELQVVNRGERSYVTTFPERALDNDYATCTADLCPVGALTSRDFRFKMRVWFLNTVDSVCSGCARGCNIHLEHGNDEVQRYRPRENAEVNDWWMCDAGRLSYQEFQTDRLDNGRIGDAGHPTREVLGAMARKLLAFGRGPGYGALAIVPSLLSTNEDLFALAKLTGALDGAVWYEGGRADGKADDILQVADKNPNRAGMRAIAAHAGITVKPLASLAADIVSGAVQGTLWCGHEHAVDQRTVDAVAGLSLRLAFASNGAPSIAAAHLVAPVRTFEEVDGTWSNLDGRVQKISAGPRAPVQALASWDAFYTLTRSLGKMDIKPPYNAAALTTLMASEVAAFAGITFETLSPAGQSTSAAA